MIKTKVTLEEARARLVTFRQQSGGGPHRAAVLAEVVWPEGRWRSTQGAGAAATRVLKKLGCHWTSTKHNWGWILTFPKGTKPAVQHRTVHARELSAIAMVARNESTITKVVHGGKVRRWVGFGWVDEGPAQSPRDDALPRVVQD